MGVSDDRPQREAAQVEPGAFAGDGAGDYRGHPDNWAKQGAAPAPNGGDPDGPAHAPVDKDAPYDMPSIPRAGATDADFAAGTTVERVVGHDEWRALVPEMVAACVEINECVGCTRQFFTKSFLGDDATVLAESRRERPTRPRHRAGVASMA